jgi:hypothetical protein
LTDIKSALYSLSYISIKFIEGGIDMSDVMEETKHKQRFVWVKDKKGNEFVCYVEDLKDPKKVSDDELKNCLDDGSRGIPIGD